MTEKRFIYCFEGIEDKWETVEEYKYTPCTKDGFQDLCYMLNELNDENEQLKQQLRNSVELFRKDSVTLFELKEENKELKVNYKELRYANNIYCNKIDSLKKENEQLKKENNILKASNGEYEDALARLEEENEQLKQENEWLKSEIQKLYNFVKIDVDHNIEVYPKSLMEHILEILKIIGDVE